jgi:hypothetical protein
VATTQRRKKRKLFAELMEGVSAMRAHREGRITVRSHRVEPLLLPSLDRHAIRARANTFACHAKRSRTASG